MTEVCECVYTGAMYTFVYKSIAEERERDGELFLLLLRFIFSSLSLSRLLSSLIQPAVSEPPFSFYSVLSPSSFFFSGFFSVYFSLFFYSFRNFRCHIYKVIISVLFFSFVSSNLFRIHC